MRKSFTIIVSIMMLASCAKKTSQQGGRRGPEVLPHVRLETAFSLYQLRRDQEALRELEKINRSHANALLRVKVDSLGLLISDRLETETRSSVRFAFLLLDDDTEVSPREDRSASFPLVTREEALARVQNWMEDGAVTVAEIEKLPLDAYKGKISGGYVFYQYGKELSQAGDQKKAHDVLSAYIETYPQHEMYAAAKLLFTEVGGRLGEKPIKIGVIVPLTGKYRVYGESVLHGIECAAGLFEPCLGPPGIELIIRDSEGEAAKAVRAVEELSEQNVQAIIGPLTSQEVVDAAKRSEELSVPMISLSQKEGVAHIGKYIFRNSITPASQVKTLIDYVIGTKQLKRFFILYPDNPLGKEFETLFREEAQRQGGTIVGSRSYLSHRMDFAEQLRGVDDVYDAVFIPDSPRVIGFLAPTLSMLGVNRVTYLGTTRWDNPDLIERGGHYINGAIFIGGYVKASTEFESQNFTQRFQDAYALEPTLLEALGYDSLRMLLVSIEEGLAVERKAIQERLSALQHFQGVTGLITIDPEGEVHRRLTLLTVTDGEIRPVAHE